MQNEMKKNAQKWAWSLAEGSNAAMAAKARADHETFLPVIEKIQQETLTTLLANPALVEAVTKAITLALGQSAVSLADKTGKISYSAVQDYVSAKVLEVIRKEMGV